MAAPQVCLFSNDAQTTLAGAITNTATTATLATGSGALFPAPGSGEFFVGSFFDAATGLVTEIVHVTSRTGDVITMIRGQEGTTAAAWNSGDIFGVFITAGLAGFMMQQGQNFLTDTGTANAVTVSFLPGPTDLASLIGVPLWIKKSAAANTGATTLAANGFAATSIVNPDGSALGSGALPANGVFCAIYDGTVFQKQSSAVLGVAVGECRLVLSSSTLIELIPFNGNGLTINGVIQTVPSAGVTLSNVGLAASTSYYIYAFMNAGVMTLEASTTTHATDATTGVQIKSGDATRSLVGAAFTDASVHFNDSGALRNLASWFNRQNKPIQGGGLNAVTSTSTTPIEISSSARAEVWAWGDDSVYASINGSTGNNTTGGTTQTVMGLDGASSGIGSTTTAAAPNYTEACNGNFSQQVSEGHHTLSIFGDVQAGTTGVWTASILGTVRS